MAKKTPDYFQGDIIIDEAHPHRVPELMGLQVVQTTVTISDVLCECPSVQPIAEGQSEKGQWLTASSFERTCEQVRTLVSPLCPRVFLLGLDDGHHRLIDQRNHVFLFELHLVKFEIPLMFVITDEAIKRERTEFADPQATFEQDGDHTQHRGVKRLQMLADLGQNLFWDLSGQRLFLLGQIIIKDQALFGKVVPVQTVSTGLKDGAQGDKDLAFPCFTDLAFPEVPNVFYNESPAQFGDAQMGMRTRQKSGKGIQNVKLLETIARAVNGDVVAHVLFCEVAKPGLGYARKVQMMRCACRVDLQAHFVHIPNVFFDLGPVVVGISNNLVYMAEPADDFVFSVLVMHQDLLRIDIFVGRVIHPEVARFDQEGSQRELPLSQAFLQERLCIFRHTIEPGDDVA